MKRKINLEQFFTTEENAKDNYLKLKFDLDNTVGARSLSKTEIIKKYYNTYIKKS